MPTGSNLTPTGSKPTPIHNPDHHPKKAVGTLFIGYRLDAKETHFPCAIYLEKRLGLYLSATALMQRKHIFLVQSIWKSGWDIIYRLPPCATRSLGVRFWFRSLGSSVLDRARQSGSGFSLSGGAVTRAKALAS